MPEGDSSSSPQNGPNRSGEDDSGAPRIWRGIKALLFREETDQSLRAQLEEVIDDHEDSGSAGDRPESGDLSHVEREMLRNLLHFSEHDVDDVAVPRGDIIAVAEDSSFDGVVQLFAEHGHSRMPVYRGSLDEIIGMIHIKDVFAIIATGKEAPADWTSLMRQPRFVPQAMGVLDLLAEMRATRTHLAVVLDEYSGTDGLVSIEDLVEEIVGEIEDEHDDEPEAMLTPLEGGLWDADARAELGDVAKIIDPALAEVDEDVGTLGGLAFVLAGEVPQAGQILRHDSGWRIEIVEGDDRRVTRLRLHPQKQSEHAES